MTITITSTSTITITTIILDITIIVMITITNVILHILNSNIVLESLLGLKGFQDFRWFKGLRFRV